MNDRAGEASAAGRRRARPGGPPDAPDVRRLLGDDLEIVRLIAAGEPLGAVARRSAVSERTLRRRLARMCARLDVETPIEAVVIAARAGLV